MSGLLPLDSLSTEGRVADRGYPEGRALLESADWGKNGEQLSSSLAERRDRVRVCREPSNTVLAQDSWPGAGECDTDCLKLCRLSNSRLRLFNPGASLSTGD